MPMIAFTLTATQVGTLDAAAIAVATLSDTTTVVRVPKALVLCKQAGDAYTVSADARIEVKDEDGNIWFSAMAPGLFGATKQCRVLLPLVSGRVFSGSNNVLSVSVTPTASIAKGTDSPSLRGRLYFDEYQIDW